MAEIAEPKDTAGLFSWLNRLSAQSVFVLVAGFFGIAMALITPPIQVPDEPHHWFRVYQLSQGEMLARDYGGDIPTVIDDISNEFASIAWNPLAKTSAAEIRSRLQLPLNPRATRFISFPNTALYSIVPYAPQTLGMFIARKLQWPALGLLYAGRIGTVLGYVLIGWAAIRLTPILKWPACMILTSPMALFLAGSVSADPITTAMVFLATAVALRCILRPSVLSNGAVAAFAAVMVAVTLCKGAYFPVSLLVLAVPRDKWGGGRRRWILPAVIILLSIGTFAGWSWLAGAGQVKERGDGPSLQLHWIFQHPLEYLKVIRLTMTSRWNVIVDSGVSELGWLDVRLLPCVVDFIYIALIWITLAYDEDMRLGMWPRLIAVLALLVSVALIITANYMVWNAVGFPIVEGLQGRYFIPIAMLMCMVFRRRGTYKPSPKWMLVLLSAISLYTVWVLIERYYLAPGIVFSVLSGSSNGAL